MILDTKALAWQEKVTAEALRRGWNVYHQVLRNQRQHDPSVILLRHHRMIVAYLRTAKPRARPPIERFDPIPGVESVVWLPADWPIVVAQLISDRPLPLSETGTGDAR